VLAPVEGNRAYWESRLADSFSLEGVGYSGLGRSFNGWMYRVRRAVVARRVRRLLAGKPPRSVLDIGSGTGFYLDLWRRLGAASVTGSDITDTAVDRLRERFPGTQLVRFDAGGEKLPLPRASFDVVSAFDVLFHVVDDRRYERALANIRELLVPGGLFFFTDNFLHGPAVRAKTQVSRSLDSVRASLDAAGLEVVERRPLMVLTNAPVDSHSRLLHAWWAGLARAARASEALGWVAGAVLYPVELALVSLLREGPTTELMVCRRPPGPKGPPLRPRCRSGT
jgi:SAM-dependent methyltransferase